MLVYSGLKLLRQGKTEIHPEKNPVLRLFRRAFPVTQEYVGGQFFTRRLPRDGLYATPLLVVLLVVETSDILFAVDSIPAVLAITLNAFIVYTSNVFAILGLRSMYFALAGMMDLFHYLHYGLSRGADFCRDQNAGVALREHSNRMGAGDRAFCFGSFDSRLAAESRVARTLLSAKACTTKNVADNSVRITLAPSCVVSWFAFSYHRVAESLRSLNL